SPERFVNCFTRKPNAVVHRLRKYLSCRLAARYRRGKCAECKWLFVPARRMTAFDRIFEITAVKTSQPIEGERDHLFVALGGEVASKSAGEFDRAERRAGRVREQCSRARARRFLEHQFVGAQIERVVGYFERYVIVTSELEPCEGVDLTFRHPRGEL